MWHVVRINYFEPDKLSLIVNGIQPALEYIQTRKIYLTSHWKKGPHLLLHIDTEENFYENGFPLLKENLDQWLSNNPSLTTIDEKKYEKLSEVLGAYELIKGPYTPLSTNNSVETVGYDPKIEIYQNEKLVVAKDNFLSATFNIILDALEEVYNNGSDSKHTRILEMMVCIASVYHSGLKYGHLTFRSHAEAYVNQFNNENNSVKEDMDYISKQLQEKAEHTVTRVNEQFESGNKFKDVDPLLSNWIEELEIFKDNLMHIFEKENKKLNENFLSIAEEVGEHAESIWNEKLDESPDISELSDFHQKLLNDESLRNFLIYNPKFQTYRFIVNTFYYLLPLFKVSPKLRHIYCNTLANAVENTLQVNWRLLLEESEHES